MPGDGIIYAGGSADLGVIFHESETEEMALVPARLLTEDQLRELRSAPVTQQAQAPADNTWKISVYLDDGLVFDYEVSGMASAREHAAAIQEHGYRSVSAETPHIATYFPVHRIRKVKVTGPTAMPTAYTDTARGT